MGDPSRAVKDWERYIVNIIDHQAVNQIRAKIAHLKKQPSQIH